MTRQRPDDRAESTVTEQAIRTLRDARVAIVLAHIAAENRHDIEGVLATFHQPCYEVNGDAYDGGAAVRTLLGALLDAFPDLHIDPGTLRHTDDAVIGEGRMTGAHRGAFVGVAATGRRIDLPTVGIFEFDDDRLINEKVIFDSATLFRQLGAFPMPSATEEGAVPTRAESEVVERVSVVKVRGPLAS